MPVDRKIYKTPFRNGSIPQWECPSCSKGVFKGEKGSFFYKETKESSDAQDIDGWDPTWIEYIYSCRLICTNPSCKSVIVSSGTGSVEYEQVYKLNDEIPDIRHYDYFQPKVFIPNLNIFNVAPDTPDDVKQDIKKSFELFFINQSSSLNQLRIAIEKILSHLRIKKYTKTKKGRMIPITLHARIELLPRKHQDVRDLLIAIKWLGNTGSHSSDATIDDVMDAYDIFEIILNNLFDSRLSEVKKIASQVNKKKGRIKRNM